MQYRRIYISATNQHVGKTTTTLGLVHALRNAGLNVGYCKPVGQKSVRVRNGQVDKDAVVFAQFMDFDIEPNIHSPVILGPGSVAQYLDNPSAYNFPNRIEKSARILYQRHEVVVFEGTGHPGVGSVVGVSNADVAKLLGAGVIMVVEAGIGSTIDRLNLSKAIFIQRDVPILGVIVNKTIPDKKGKIEHYVGLELEKMGIPLLGVIPFDEELALPLMLTIAQTLNGRVLHYEDQLDNRVKGIIAGSLIDKNELKANANLLLVVSISRLDEAIKKISQFSATLPESEPPLSGIIITGHGEINENALTYVHQYRIPVVHSLMDTYESVIKISKIEVKINTRTPWKISKAVNLFEQHVHIDPIVARIREGIHP